MEPIDQLEVFLSILRVGVEIVALTDRMWFSRERVRKDNTALLVSIIKMTQSFDESDKKAQRLAAVWENNRAKIAKAKTPVTSVCPGWIRLNRTNGQYELIDERAALVREIFTRTLKSEGKRTIAIHRERARDSLTLIAPPMPICLVTPVAGTGSEGLHETGKTLTWGREALGVADCPYTGQG
jgi:hypothetical protein